MEKTLGDFSNSELAGELAKRIEFARNVDGYDAQGLFGPRPDGSRPILDALAGLLNSAAFQKILMDLLLKLLGNAGKAHEAPVAANPVK